MSRKLLTVLIVVVGMAGAIVAAVATFAQVKERTVTSLPGPIRVVEIDVEAGRVEIRPGLVNEVKVDRTRRYLLGAPEAQETVVDGVLRVQVACESWLTLGCSVDYVVEVPAAVAVRVRTAAAPWRSST